MYEQFWIKDGWLYIQHSPNGSWYRATIDQYIAYLNNIISELKTPSKNWKKRNELFDITTMGTCKTW